MKIEVVRARHHGDARDVLADLCEEMATALAELPEFAASGDAPVRLVLGGQEELDAWDIGVDAVGFNAVARVILGEEDDNGDTPIEYDINEFNESHVNLDAGLRHLREGWAHWSQADRASEIIAFLVTVPHELLHTAEWIRETGGKTPLEVFDAGRGEREIRDVQTAIEKRITAEHGDEEDYIEGLARDIAERTFGGRAHLAAEKLDAVMGSSPARSPR